MNSGKPQVLWLFCHDWDDHARVNLSLKYDIVTSGFSLFRFPSNARLINFSILNFTENLSRKHSQVKAVVSHDDQFGCLSASILAKKLSLSGPSPEAIFKVQHKFLFRKLLAEICPTENLHCQVLEMDYGGGVPEGLKYPFFIKPIKAAFSVLSSKIKSKEDLKKHLKFGIRELWVIKRLVEPFEEVRKDFFPMAPSAHQMIYEELVTDEFHQFNFDGWVEGGQVHSLGFIDAIYYPGTRQFQRWELPSRRLPIEVQNRILEISQKIVTSVGLDQTLFNLEFFYNPRTSEIKIIEMNPRLASQFSDLYQKVRGINPHEISILLAQGKPSSGASQISPKYKVAASFVYRAFDLAGIPPKLTRYQLENFELNFPDSVLIYAPKSGHSLERDFKWTQSHRYGILNTGAQDWDELQIKSQNMSELLNWPVC